MSESKLKSPPEGDDIGFVNMEESMETNVDKEKNEENQELDPATQSEDEVLSEKTKVHEDSSGTKRVEDEAEKIDQINIHQGSIHQGSVMENMNSLNVSPKESSGRSIEQVQNLDESAAMCLDALTGVENTDEKTGVNQEQDYHDQEKTMDFSPTMLSNPGTQASDSE